jgi:hypothetical protein
MPICKQYFAKVDEYGFPIPGTMMGFNGTPGTCDLALACSMVQLPQITYVLQTGDKQIFRPGGLRYFVVLDSNGYIRPNSLMARFTVPQGVRTAEFIKYIPAA